MKYLSCSNIHPFLKSVPGSEYISCVSLSIKDLVIPYFKGKCPTLLGIGISLDIPVI